MGILKSRTKEKEVYNIMNGMESKCEIQRKSPIFFLTPIHYYFLNHNEDTINQSITNQTINQPSLHMGAGASAVGKNPGVFTDDTGPPAAAAAAAAAPELSSSAMARWGFVRCLMQRSGKNTPAMT